MGLEAQKEPEEGGRRKKEHERGGKDEEERMQRWEEGVISRQRRDGEWTTEQDGRGAEESSY